MGYWLKVAGSGDAPITTPDWYAAERRWGRKHGYFSGFPRRPTVKPGDRLVSYAASSGELFGAPRFFAVQEALTWPELGTHEQWVWAIKTRTVVPGPLLTFAPTLDQIGVSTLSVRRQSHIKLTEEQGLEAEELLRAAVARHGTPYFEATEDESSEPDARAGLADDGRRERIEAIKRAGERMSLPDLDRALRTRGR